MKRTPVLMILGIFITLLFLQFSCGTTKEYRAEGISPEVEETPEKALLLADKHEVAGIECNDCHEATPPDSEVPEVVCLTCHANYKELTVSYFDPHNGHMTYSGCGDCHHAHRPSENQCQACHY